MTMRALVSADRPVVSDMAFGRSEEQDGMLKYAIGMSFGDE